MNVSLTTLTSVASSRPSIQGRQIDSKASVPTFSITLGIVVFNNTAAELKDLAITLRRAIMRLEESETGANRETTVFVQLFNNGYAPVDPTAFGLRTRLNNSSTNLGFGRAHNVMMAEAFAVGAEFYIALNPDGILHPDVLVEMVAVARWSDGRALVEAAQFPEEMPKTFDPLTLDTPWASGCCLLVPAAIHTALGGFDENIFMYCEDVDLSWRARHAGYAVKHAPRALFGHSFSRPGMDYVKGRAHLDAARYLATKWGNQQFAKDLEREMASNGWLPGAVPASTPISSSIVDFEHGLSFAPERWRCPAPIPQHTIVRHADVDNTIDVIVRFHDPAQLWRLTRCLFSLYSQRHQPIQVLLMLQNLDEAGVAAVNACVDALDWTAPRRRPKVTNVAVPPGDRRGQLWNAGLDVGKSRYVGFCDYDDIVYPACYSYLLHRLQYTDAAAAFASSLHVDCTPMRTFDYSLGKRALPGQDRYDFFASNFCPPNSVLIDRSRVTRSELRTDESLSKNEDYRVFAVVVANYETDWASMGTAVADYVQRTDGSNTVLSHGNGAASRREWDESNKRTQQFLAALATKVPVSEIVSMRGALQNLRRELSEAQAAAAYECSRNTEILDSFSWKVSSPVRVIGRLARRLRSFYRTWV